MTRRAAKISADDLRVVAAVAAGTFRADEVWTQDGWRKAPAQCPILMSLIKGEAYPEMMAIMEAWVSAYRVRCNEYEKMALSA